MSAPHPPGLSSTDDAPPAVPPSLLLVDDEPSVLNALRRLFRSQGWRLHLAGSGTEGLEILQREKIDLVVSDMRMPVMDGAKFLEAVRRHDPSTGRILLTGYADITSTIAAINNGEIHRYVAKPWDDQALLLTVREVLSRRELEHRNAELLALTQKQNHDLAELNHSLEDRVKSRTAELEQVNAMLTTAYEDLNRHFTLAVTVFSGLMEMRQDGIAGHSRRVASLVQRLCPMLGIEGRAQQDVHLAALLHDIGKIGFPDRMLGKPVSTFGPEELARYRRHPVDGEAALMALEQLQGAAHLIRQHHERWDGHGFPDGLTGEEIALGARIIAVVSDYDGLVYGGLAERKLSVEAALQSLRGGIDTRYDRRVVEALVTVIEALQTEARSDVDMEPEQLKPGMVLAQDLLSPKGAILLTAGHVFDDRVIRVVKDFSVKQGLKLTLSIRRDSIPRPMLATARPQGALA